MPISTFISNAAPQTSQSTPVDPTGTTSLTQVMMGLAIAFTPNKSGKVFVSYTSMGANGTISDGLTYTAKYGTGTAPVNGAATTGTVIHTAISVDVAAAAERIPCNGSGIITLTPGTAYWFDLSLAAITAGTATLKNITFCIIEYQL